MAPSTIPAPTSTSQPIIGPYVWARDTSPALAVGGGASSTLAGVLPPTGARRWIVAGTRIAGDGSSTATAWTSPDGISWDSTPLTGPQVDSQAEAATTWRTDTVIVGSVGRGTDQRAVAWISPTPGAPFVEVPADELPVPASSMTSVSGGALGLFAAGGAGGHAAIWYSNNGRRWIRLHAAEQVIASADDPHVDALLVAPDAVYAAGWDRRGPSIVGALWSSGDGVNWHPVQSARAAFGGAGDHMITALASLGTPPLGTGLVAAGGSRIGSRWSPASWISPDGASWSQPSPGFSLGARAQPDSSEAIVRGLSATPTGPRSATLVAVGGGPTAQRMWKSADGLHWAELPLPPGAAASDRWHASLTAVAGSTTVVADGDPGQPHLLVRRPSGWLEPSADPALFGPVQAVARPAGLLYAAGALTLAVDIARPGQVLGQGGSSLELLTSTDATTWTAVAAGAPFAGGVVDGLAARPGGLVAVGWRGGPGGEQATVWTSPDGRTWRGAPLDPRPVARSDQASGVCASGNLVAAVGSVQQVRGGSAARAWVSRDGVHWLVSAIAPAAHPGAADAMAGCVPASSEVAGRSGFDAFGTAAANGANPVPAFWKSGQGVEWTQQAESPFGPGFPFPAAEVAPGRQVLLATAAAAEPEPAWIAAGSQSGLWRSTDAGANWKRLDSTGTPWQGSEPAQIDRATLFGTTPVVAGQVDGRLAVWTGIPTG